jgi:SAM-dependent methyltransferase
LEKLPIFCNVLHVTARDARNAPLGDVALTRCSDCGLIFNSVFDADQVRYSPGYENSLHYSHTFQAYATGLARDLVERHDLTGRTVLEIGPGQGDFLSMLVEAGAAHGIGLDPSWEPSSRSLHPGVSIRSEAFGPGFAATADFVVARHVLEHVEDPRSFISTVAEVLRVNGGSVYIEVPDASYMLIHAAVFDVIYEHPSYFTRAVLVRLAGETGLEVTHTGTAFDGQFLSIEAQAGQVRFQGRVPSDGQETSFARRARSVIDLWDHVIGELSSEEDAAVWGVGSKGVTFLNAVPAAARGARAVDVNPRKWRFHVPGVARVVESPDDLARRPPALVIVMNRVYEREVRMLLAERGVSCKVVSV